MEKNTSIPLGDHFDGFIAAQVAAGHYSNASEVMCAGLRLLEEHEGKLGRLRHALIEGERSGDAGPLDMAAIRREARSEAGLDA